MTDKLSLEEAVKRVAELDAKRTPGEYYVEGIAAYTPNGESLERMGFMVMLDDKESILAQELWEKDANFFAASALMARTIAELMRQREMSREAIEASIAALGRHEAPIDIEACDLCILALKTITSKEPCV